MQTDEEKLKVLMERRAKADKLPSDKLKRWKKQYDEICLEIVSLNKKLNKDSWNEVEAVKEYIDAVKWISVNLNWQNKEQFLNDNKNLMELVIEAGDKVDRAFYLMSMNEVHESIENCKKVCSRVDDAYKTYAETGFTPAD